VSPAWEPPGGPRRVVGGLLGVAGGEELSLAGRRTRARCACTPDGPVTAALVDLCHTYVARRGRGVPVDVATRHDGVAGPAWLLAVAVVRSNPRQLVADTLELASAAGVPTRSLGEHVAYVELAAGLLAGDSSVSAIERVTGGWLPVCGSEPQLCGESSVDALSASMWALIQPGGLAEVVPTLADCATPSVGAAAAGLLGLRDGCDAVPVPWQRSLRAAATCVALAPGLVRARCQDHGRRNRPVELAGAGVA
jgi:hypothetical protein